MQCKHQFFLVLLFKQMLNVALDLVCHQNRGVDFSCSITRRANFLGGNVHLRAYTLTSDLHQPEFGKRKYSMLSAITLHLVFHFLRDELLVIRISHIYEIYNNNSAHTTNTQQPRKLTDI